MSSEELLWLRAERVVVEEAEEESERKSEGSDEAAFLAKREERLSSCDFWLPLFFVWGRRCFDFFFFFFYSSSSLTLLLLRWLLLEIVGSVDNCGLGNKANLLCSSSNFQSHSPQSLLKLPHLLQRPRAPLALAPCFTAFSMKLLLTVTHCMSTFFSWRRSTG